MIWLILKHCINKTIQDHNLDLDIKVQSRAWTVYQMIVSFPLDMIIRFDYGRYPVLHADRTI